MKLFKYHINFKAFAVLLIALALGSCKKALQLDPISEYSLDQYFKSTAQANAALRGGYRTLQTALNQEFVYYGEGRSDNVAEGGGSLSSNTLSVLNNTLDGNLSYARWDPFYNVIKQANLLIKNVPLMRANNVIISDADYNRILGQAYGLRALAYFYIVRVWGDAPLVTEPLGNIEDLNALKTPKVDKSIIYSLISDDLKKALIAPTSNSSNQETRGMLTRNAIYAMQTDYYMWRNMPDSAILSSSRLIKDDGTSVSSSYKLVELYNPSANYSFGNTNIDQSPYSKMFVDGLSDESIFEVVYSFNENINSNIFGIYGNNNSQFYGNSEFVSSFGNDLRAIATFKNDIRVYKFFPKGTYDQTTQNDKNVIVYRLADIMLLRAEALNIQNRRDEAFLLVNMIRRRAGLAEITQLTYNSYSTADAQEVILEERRKELCFEGKRWFDLVRTGKVFTKVINPVTMQPRITDPRNLVWPISLDVIRENPLIEQNEFYK